MQKAEARAGEPVSAEAVYLHALQRLHAYTRYIETSGAEGKKLSPTELQDLLLMVRELGRTSRPAAPRASKMVKPMTMQQKTLKQLLDEATATYPELAEALEGIGA